MEKKNKLFPLQGDAHVSLLHVNTTVEDDD